MPDLTDQRNFVRADPSDAAEVIAGSAFRLTGTATGFPGTDLTGAEFYMNLEFGEASVQEELVEDSGTITKKITVSSIELTGGQAQIDGRLYDQASLPNQFYFDFPSDLFPNPEIPADGDPVPIAVGTLQHRTAAGNDLARFIWVIRRGVVVDPPVVPNP